MGKIPETGKGPGRVIVSELYSTQSLTHDPEIPSRGEGERAGDDCALEVPLVGIVLVRVP